MKLLHNLQLYFSKSITKTNIRIELLSGLTVGLALVPEAIAFSFIAGVEPLVGLYGAVIVGLFAAVFGGRPGMISGATGALAVVMVDLVMDHGVEYIFATGMLVGVIQILAGVFKLGKFIRLIPHPVMLGFVNGLAIVILLAQFPLLSQEPSNPAGPFTVGWLETPLLAIMLGLIGLTMLIVWVFPKITTKIPSSLVAIIVVSLLVILFHIPTSTIKDMANIPATLPIFHIPSVPFTWETLWIILPYAIILAAIGLMESLMTLSLIDEITETRGKTSKECIGQGLGNVVTGFFTAMPGCAMIGQSMINVNSGGRSRLSGISAALFLFFFIVFFSSIIEHIPLAALVGVMFIVVIKTFAWSSLRILKKIPKSDAFVLILVSVVTIFTDLAIAVISGVIVSAIVFAWEKAKEIQITTSIKDETKYYFVNGPLFFASVYGFKKVFTINEDPQNIVIDFANSRVQDHSALEAITLITQKYSKLNKTVKLKHLSLDCQRLLQNAEGIIEVNREEDPRYFVVIDAKQ